MHTSWLQRLAACLLALVVCPATFADSPENHPDKFCGADLHSAFATALAADDCIHVVVAPAPELVTTGDPAPCPGKLLQQPTEPQEICPSVSQCALQLERVSLLDSLRERAGDVQPQQPTLTATEIKIGRAR